MDNFNLQQHIYSKCNNPVVIYNKCATYHICNTRSVFVNGKELPISLSELDTLVNDSRLPSLFKYLQQQIKFNNDNITKYFVSSTDGQIIPLFYLVPCRKCPFCYHSRSRDIQTRAMCENMTSSTPPIAVLLTYDNEHLPHNGVSKDDIDKFLKRLRIKLVRDGHTNPLRFLLVSEYGTKRGRAHYHMILWNFPVFDTNKTNNYYKVRDYIHSVWLQGFVSVRFTHEGNNSTSAAATHYFVKYAYKGSNIPKGKNETFIKSSRRPGLGSEWLKLNEEFYLKNTFTKELIIRDKWSNITYKATFPKYFQDKLFPSISKLVRKDIRDIYKIFLRLVPYYSKEDVEYIKEKYWFLPYYELPRLYKKNFTYVPLKYFIPNKNTYGNFEFTDFDDLKNFVYITLNMYQISENLTDELINLKVDFASQYFDLLDATKIPLPNMSRYEYHDYMNRLIKNPQSILDDEQ